jgi:hypothetical protein
MSLAIGRQRRAQVPTVLFDIAETEARQEGPVIGAGLARGEHAAVGRLRAGKLARLLLESAVQEHAADVIRIEAGGLGVESRATLT